MRSLIRLAPRLLAATEISSVACLTRNGAAAAISHLGAPAGGSAARAAAALWQRPMSGLTDMLDKEMEYERSNYQQPEELAAGPPPPFTLTEAKGDTLLKLERDHAGEKVTVELMVNEQPDEEAFESEEGEIEVDLGCAFTAAVTKGDQSLVFECKSDGTYLEVLHASLEPASGELEDTAYTGPVYEELDEELQQRFTEFLAERGVDEKLGEYLLRLVHDKEQREYMGWLERVQKFLQK